MNPDHRLQKSVLDELDFNPDIDSSHIGVSVRDRIVTLSGHVSSNAEKRAAEITAGKVAGVRAVIDDLVVELPGKTLTDDEALAEHCCAALAADPSVDVDRIHIGVKDGIVTARGDVDSEHQRTRIAEKLAAVGRIRGVANELIVRPPVRAEAVREKIRQVLEPISPINAEKIEVRTKGTHVVLKGYVNSWHERGMAESAVWSIPGVTSLDDQLKVL